MKQRAIPPVTYLQYSKAVYNIGIDASLHGKDEGCVTKTANCDV